MPYKARLNAVANHIKLPVRIRFLSTLLQLLFYHLTKNARNQLREYKKTREQKKLIVRRLAHKRQQRMASDFTQNSKRISTLFPRDSSKSEGDEREEEVEKAHTMNLTGGEPFNTRSKGMTFVSPRGFHQQHHHHCISALLIKIKVGTPRRASQSITEHIILSFNSTAWLE